MDVDLLKNLLNKNNVTDVSLRTGLSRQTLHNFLNGKNPTLETLTKLQSYLCEENEVFIFESLAYYGAPLAVTQRIAHYDLNQTLKKGLELSKRNALIASTLPFVFFKQRASIDLIWLFRESIKSDTDKLMGYFLETAHEFRNFIPFKMFAKSMNKLGRYDKYQPTKLNGETVNSEFLPLYTQNSLALHWGLLDHGKLSSHISRFEKWYSQENG